MVCESALMGNLDPHEIFRLLHLHRLIFYPYLVFIELDCMECKVDFWVFERRYWWYRNPPIKMSSVHPTIIYLYDLFHIHKNDVKSSAIFMNSPIGLIKTWVLYLKNLSSFLFWQLLQLPSFLLITIFSQTIHTFITYIWLFWYKTLGFYNILNCHWVMRFFKCNIFQLR